MPEGKKFRPVITRVKLNPEQAVLACCSIAYGKGSGARAKSMCENKHNKKRKNMRYTSPCDLVLRVRGLFPFYHTKRVLIDDNYKEIQAG